MAEEMLTVSETLEPASMIDVLAHPEKYPSYLYCSVPKPDNPTTEQRLQYTAYVMQMLNQGDYRAAESINERINLCHVLAHRITVRNVDKDTGEVTEFQADRVVLLDDEDKTYEAVSQGLGQSVLVLFQLMGKPDTWDSPVPVVIRQVETKAGRRTFKLEIWRDKATAKK